MVSRKARKFLNVCLTILLVSFLTAGVAYAATIIIDGVREPVWDAGAVVRDNGGDEGDITNAYDIEKVEFTNSTGYFYIMVDTFANTNWDNTGDSDPSMTICLDTISGGGTGVEACDHGDMIGVDYLIEINGGASLNIAVYDYLGNPVSDSRVQVASAANITELRVPNSVLGLGSGNCGSIAAKVRLNNGGVEPEDETPDSGTANFNCGSITTANLVSLSAHSETSPFHWWVFVLVVLAVNGVSTLVVYGFHNYSKA